MTSPCLLAFDTSTDVLSIGVCAHGHTELRTLAGGAQSSATLIPTAMDMLAQAGMGLSQLDAIVFGRGPGSFTGLRTACAVAQGLAFGADRLVLPVDTLLAVAEEARVQSGSDAPLTVLALLDARMNEVYSAACDWDGRHWTLRQALQLLTEAQTSRTTRQSPQRWSDNDAWKADYANPDLLSAQELASLKEEAERVRIEAKALREKTLQG